MIRQSFSDTEMISLLLRQSMLDSEADFQRLLDNPGFPHWDCIVLTASNPAQADGYRRQVAYRQSVGRFPGHSDFLVVPDRDGQRVGSAGATLSVIRELKKKYGDLSRKKILVIHAGGNSSRTPQYSALGKLFSPIPTLLNGAPATIFDMFLVTMASIPGRIKNGMLLLSGDVVLLFNPLMCDFGTADAAAISFKEDVETAKNHGVFLKNAEGKVRKYLHKQTADVLRSAGAVDARNKCCIDTGALWFSAAFVEKLYALVDTEEKYNAMVNDTVRLSLYGDIAYCLAQDSTLAEFYTQTPEGSFCDALTAARRILWDAISAYSMKVLTVSPARFVHFGSIPEIVRLVNRGYAEFRSIGWRKQTNCSMYGSSAAGYNSILAQSAVVGENTYLEVSYIHSKARIGKDCYISFMDLHDETIPDHVLLHGLKQKNGKFVCRIMDIQDNPKTACFFGQELESRLQALGIDSARIWEADRPHTLWEAALFPECGDIRQAAAAALQVYALFVCGSGDVQAWLRASRKSLRSGFDDADTQAILDWDRRMRELVQMDEIKEQILNGSSVEETKKILTASTLTNMQTAWLEREIQKLDLQRLPDFSYALRLYYFLGYALKDERYIQRSFELISDAVLCSMNARVQRNDACRIVRERVTVHLPLRVNWGGGWTDACPYCMENGGTVLNAAITLDGSLPVEASVVKIPQLKIVLDSRDLDEYEEFDSIDRLQNTGDPFDPFALQKACLIACGIIPRTGGDLAQILARMGGGFELHSTVSGVPKGSGLGTSSILSAACVKAMLTFIGADCDAQIVYATVLSMEQIMSTGGGWQDQVGGFVPGVKLIASEPGLQQSLRIEQVRLSEKTRRELSERFVLIYTGQRRLARNLLRSVVGRYVGNLPDSLYAHAEIRKIAVRMRGALERGDVDGFAQLLNEHWLLSQTIGSGSTNTLIGQIFMSIDDLIDGRMICGAGGGGFLQVILKRGVARKDVQDRLKTIFMDFPVDVWDSAFVFSDAEEQIDAER